jgi:hypothetical protein
VNFPGAVLLGEDNPKPDFYYWPGQTMAPQYTLDNTGAQGALTYDADLVATAFANTLDYGGVQGPFSYNGGAVPTTGSITVTTGTSSYPSGLSWYSTSAPSTGLVKSVWRGPGKAQAQAAEPMTSDITLVTEESMLPDVANAEATSPESRLPSAASQSENRIRRLRARRAARTCEQLTGLAVRIVGHERAVALNEEWRGHLAGQSGQGLAGSRQARDAARGFLIAALRTRLQDAADAVWGPADAMLASRDLSNLIAMLATIIVAVIFVHSAGVYGLVSNLVNVAITWTATRWIIRTGRVWRGVKLPEHKPRRSKELARFAR